MCFSQLTNSYYGWKYIDKRHAHKLMNIPLSMYKYIFVRFKLVVIHYGHSISAALV